MESHLTRYLPTFVQAANDLNFSETARNLGLTPAAVSKAIRTLEERLGTQLFYRSTHVLTLTNDGEQLLRRAAPHLEGIEEALIKVRNLPHKPQGKLRISAPYAFSRQFIIPLLKGFNELYPDVDLDLFFDDQVMDLVRDKIDIGIGVRLDPGNTLIVKKLCDIRVFFVASPAFLEKYGMPDHPQNLPYYPCVRFRSHTSGRLMPWEYVDEEGTRNILNPPPKIVVSSQELLCDLAAQGLGIAMAGWVAQPYIESGDLISILESYTLIPPPLSIYYSSKANLPAKVRVFIDYVNEHMQRPNVSKSGRKVN